ncbi:Fc.00g034990.m01.CDS01 [Cosmosporella sp. VM-42]
MPRNVLPNWPRIILLVLSFLSYLPQLRRILAKRDSSNISLYYILFNLIVATEQFTLGYVYIVSHHHDLRVFVCTPRNVGDWLNLTQLTIVWLMSLALFAICIFYSLNTRGHKACVLAIYISFLLISLVPLFIDPIDEKDPYSIWFGGIIFGAHFLWINPIITFLGVLAPFFQWRKAVALSTTGLCAQASIFAFVALSWVVRVEYPVMERVSLRIFLNWCRSVGWAAVDNAVFAVSQFVLLCLAKHQKPVDVDSVARPDEEEPLLAS